MVIARVLRVSVDLCATIQTPVSLQTVVGTAGAMLCDLLGLTSVPQIKVFADPLFEQGRRIREGRLVEDDALAAETVGGRMSAGYFEFRIPETGDSAWFFVAAEEGMLDAVFSPTRTCVGVVLATALALATAYHGRGAFLDREIRMLETGESDPEEVVTRTKLAQPGILFTVQCEQYMRQFPRLNGWPADVACVPR